MKKLLVLTIILTTVFVACDEASQNEIANIKPVSKRINDLNKTMDEIKTMEDDAALMREDNYLLEYEYPVRENESYVITYRFKDNKCYEIKLDTYLDKEAYAKKIQQEVMTDMAENSDFSKTTFRDDTFKWVSIDTKINIQLKTQNVERGTVNLSIVINQ